MIDLLAAAAGAAMLVTGPVHALPCTIFSRGVCTDRQSQIYRQDNYGSPIYGPDWDVFQPAAPDPASTVRIILNTAHGSAVVTMGHPSACSVICRELTCTLGCDKNVSARIDKLRSSP